MGAARREPTPSSACLPTVVYTDGNAFDATDPMLARAAWAAVRETADGMWLTCVGPSPAAQAAHNAELAACMWAARCPGPLRVVVTECHFVVGGREAWAPTILGFKIPPRAATPQHCKWQTSEVLKSPLAEPQFVAMSCNRLCAGQIERNRHWAHVLALLATKLALVLREINILE